MLFYNLLTCLLLLAQCNVETVLEIAISVQSQLVASLMMLSIRLFYSLISAYSHDSGQTWTLTTTVIPLVNS